MLIIFEESYCSLSQLHSVIIYVTFSASVAQTVAVSVIGYPVQLKCTMLYPLMYPVHPVLYSVQLKCTVLYPVYPLYPVLYPVQLKSTRCCAQSHLLCRPFALTPLWRDT